MKKDDIKRCINDFEPDLYMKTRISANISQNKRHKKSFFKPALSLVMAVLLIAGFNFGINNFNQKHIVSENNSTVQDDKTSFTNLNSLDFAITAYAADDNGKTGTDVMLSDKNINFINDLKVIQDVIKSIPARYVYTVSGKCGFDIKADNMKKVTVKTDNGSLYYYNDQLKNHLIEENEYYAAIIPLTQEQNEPLKDLKRDEWFSERDTFEEFMKNNDVSAYLQGVDFNECGVEYDNSGDTPCYKLYPFEKENSFWIHHTDEISIDIYNKKDGVADLEYHPDKADGYFRNSKSDTADAPAPAFASAPKDIIYITVEFENGKSVTKKLSTSFNAEGIMQIEFIK